MKEAVSKIVIIFVLSLGVSTHLGFGLAASSSSLKNHQKVAREIQRTGEIPRAVPGSFLVRPAPGQLKRTKERLQRLQGVVGVEDQGGFLSVTVDKEAEEAWTNCAKKKSCGFETEPNYIFTIPTRQSEEPNPGQVTEKTPLTPNDPKVPYQWHLWGMEYLWNLAKETPEWVKFFVPDSGLTPWEEISADYTTSVIWEDLNPEDRLGHGTSVAGTVCAEANNGLYGSGVVQDCKYLSVMKVARIVQKENSYGQLVETATFLYQDILVAMDEMERQTAKDDLAIVIMAFTANHKGLSPPKLLIDKMQEMENFIFVCAAGNERVAGGEYYPCAVAKTNERAVCVGATDEDGQLARFSNWGEGIGPRMVFLPGVNIFTATTPEKGYFRSYDGTSFSAPIAGGLLGIAAQAMAYQNGIRPTASEVVRILTDGQTLTNGLKIPWPWDIATRIMGQKVQGWIGPKIGPDRGVTDYNGGNTLAPGSLAWVSGWKLKADQTPEVWFGAFKAHVLEASTRSLLVQIPTELGVGEVLASVDRLDGSPRSNEVLVPLQASAPVVLERTLGLYWFPSPMGVITDTAQKTDTDQKTDTHLVGDPFFYPLQKGVAYTLWCTGLGPTIPLIPTGKLAPAEPPAWASRLVGLKTDTGEEVPVTFAGLAPGFVGLYQVNFSIPEDSSVSGWTKVILNAGGEEDAFWTSVR